MYVFHGQFIGVINQFFPLQIRKFSGCIRLAFLVVWLVFVRFATSFLRIRCNLLWPLAVTPVGHISATSLEVGAPGLTADMIVAMTEKN